MFKKIAGDGAGEVEWYRIGWGFECHAKDFSFCFSTSVPFQKKQKKLKTTVIVTQVVPGGRRRRLAVGRPLCFLLDLSLELGSLLVFFTPNTV